MIQGLFKVLAIWVLLYFTTVKSAFTKEQLFQKRDESSLSGIITIEQSEFDKFFNGGKDYHLIAFFTTNDPKFGCEACQSFLPAYQIISESIIKDHPSRPIFFTMVEFEANQLQFQKLQLNTVPHVWVYAPSVPENFNLKTLSFEDGSEEDEESVEAYIKALAEIDVTSEHYVYQVPESLLGSPKELELNFGEFLSQIIHINILIHRPFEIDQFLKNFLLYLGVFIILKKRGAKVLHRLNNYWVPYYVVSIVLILLSVTGYNFCMQRAVPFIAKNEQQQIMYFSGGTHYQFGLEMLNVSTIYILLAGTVIMLLTFVPTVSNKNLQLVLTMFGGALLFVFYSLLNSVFLIKDPDYPFVPWRIIF